MTTTDPANFYTGLIAELYEPLAGGITDSARFIDFVERAGQPALEMCCGTGLPLLDLIEAGLEVEGLDASPDMLALCQQKADLKGLSVKLHLSKMQMFTAPRQYQCVYIANGSITLLPDDDSLNQTLSVIRECLEPNGLVLFDLDTPDVAQLKKYIGRFKEISLDDHRLRVGMTSLAVDDEARTADIGMRYERVAADGTTEIKDSVWVRRIWSLAQFRAHLKAEGYEVVSEESISADLTQLIARRTHG